ncbi:MAG: thiopurine S-methyltransferase [Marinobacterium sp.]|nr:thiopurine S-methyltransferase [Marinobacterium sp.]
MEHDFWHQRWQEGRIGFHLKEVNPLLKTYCSAMKLPARGRVLVPLCGRSQDMIWLQQQGFDVLGVELSGLACEQFFADPASGEQSLSLVRRRDERFEYFSQCGIELWCGDIFQLQVQDLKTVNAVYDRAALIALPAQMRKAYARLLCAILPKPVSVLLVTLETVKPEPEHAPGDGAEQGPPFSVARSEVEMLFGERFEIELLDDQPADRPGTREKVYCLSPQSTYRNT